MCVCIATTEREHSIILKRSIDTLGYANIEWKDVDDIDHFDGLIFFTTQVYLHL